MRVNVSKEQGCDEHYSIILRDWKETTPTNTPSQTCVYVCLACARTVFINAMTIVFFAAIRSTA